MEQKAVVLMIREYDPEKDAEAVEEFETRMEAGPTKKLSLHTNHLGDPICRIRHSPPYLMLVAEMGPEKEIVGVIRGCIKTVACGTKITRINGVFSNSSDADDHFTPFFSRIGYILGLRVSPSHRQKGIGSKLVEEMEEWFIQNEAFYSYVAIESTNKPSLNLFLKKYNYSIFRTLSILVQPVFAHRLKIHHRVRIIQLSGPDSTALYRRLFSTTEFFPSDVDRILRNNLNLGTFLAVPTESYSDGLWPGTEEFFSDPPESWAVVSIWNCKEVFTVEVRGASRARKLASKATRLVDGAFPWLKIPSIPRLFSPFGFHFLYGIGASGPRAGRMVKSLCRHAHNVAKDMKCQVVVAEVASGDPLTLEIPHWKRLSCTNDLWCIRKLAEDFADWTKLPPGPSLFVDPREIRSYSEWVLNGDYDWPPNCSMCKAVLEEGTSPQTTRLGCLHVLHTSCLVSHIKSFPAHTAPAGYVCPECSISIWPPKSIKDSGSRLHLKLKEAIMQSGVEKNLFGNHPVALQTSESRGPPPAFDVYPLVNASLIRPNDEPNVAEGNLAVTGVGFAKHIITDTIELDGPSSAGNFGKSSSPPGPSATTRKGAFHGERQNSEDLYYADDEDGNCKKYNRSGPFRHKILRALLPFWSSALPILPMTAPPRKDGSSVNVSSEGRPRQQRSSRMDLRKVLVIAIMACLATMGILYYRLVQASPEEDFANDEQQ